MRRATALCRKAQATFVARAEIGSPAETIDRVAREIGAHQIVTGTRSLGSLGNLFLGSVAAKVVRLAQVPVTLVKQAAGLFQGDPRSFSSCCSNSP